VGDVVISAITLAELEFGVTCSGQTKFSNRSALDSFLEDIPVAPFEADAARSYRPIRAANRDRTQGALAKLIVAHAISLDVILVTNNEADFATYPGLTVENWVDNHCACQRPVMVNNAPTMVKSAQMIRPLRAMHAPIAGHCVAGLERSPVWPTR